MRTPVHSLVQELTISLSFASDVIAIQVSYRRGSIFGEAYTHFVSSAPQHFGAMNPPFARDVQFNGPTVGGAARNLAHPRNDVDDPNRQASSADQAQLPFSLFAKAHVPGAYVLMRRNLASVFGVGVDSTLVP